MFDIQMIPRKEEFPPSGHEISTNHDRFTEVITCRGITGSLFLAGGLLC